MSKIAKVNRAGLPTRVLLTCAAIAIVHILIRLATVPLFTVLAPLSPPLYGFVIGLHSLMPFLARRLTRTPGTATLTAGVAGLFTLATSPLGIIVAVPVLLAGVVIDIVVGRVDRDGRQDARVEARYLIAAVVTGCVLFAVALSVFSPEHLTPTILLLTLGAHPRRTDGSDSFVSISEETPSSWRQRHGTYLRNRSVVGASRARAKVGLGLIVAAVVVGGVGLVLLYRDYAALVEAETGRMWSPGVALSIAPVIALLLLSAGLIILLTGSRA